MAKSSGSKALYRRLLKLPLSDRQAVRDISDGLGIQLWKRETERLLAPTQVSPFKGLRLIPGGGSARSAAASG